MKWLVAIMKKFHKTSDDEIAEYRRGVEKDVQEHWKGRTIRVGELIFDCWQDPSKAPQNANSDQKYNYVVFIDIEGDLDWICDDDHVEQKVRPEVLALIAKIMDVEAIPCKHLHQAEWMAFKRMLGTAIVSAFEEELDAAEALMLHAKAYIEQRIPERSRLWTLRSATCALGIYGLVLYFLRNTTPIVAFMFGLFGAYVSLVRQASARQTDSNAGRALHCTEAFVRLLIGMMLGKMGVLICFCAIAPEFAQKICESDAGARVIAFAAGLFDSFIPAMISTYLITPMKSKGENHD